MAIVEILPSESAARRAETVRVFVLIVSYILLNVLLGVFVGEKVTFLLKDVLGLAAGTVTTLNLLINFPTYCQPFLGACTDLYPLFGSRRRAYFTLAALISAATYLALALQAPYRLAAVICCLLLAVTGGTLRSILLNAVGVAQGNRIGNYKSIRTLLQLMPLVLVMAFTGRWGGIVTEYWSYRAAFLMAALVSLAYLALLPLLEEPTRAAVTTESSQAEMAARSHRKAEAARAQRVLLRRALTDRRLWAVTAFVAYFGFFPSRDTARPYFFTDALHFTKLFIGELSAWQSAGAIIGILLMQLAPRHLRLRQLAILAALAGVLALVPLMLIHNKPSAITGMALSTLLGNVSGFAYVWMWARACPKGLEAVVYGTLASTQALFYYICDWLGTHMYDWFGPASHHSAAQGWYWSLATCIALAMPLFLFIPFLPKTDPADDSTWGAELSAVQ